MGFRGGYHFRHFEGAAKPNLRDCRIPKTAFIPFSCGRFSFTPVVKKDDPVRAGTRIMESDGDYPVYLHSPVNGTVADVSDEGVALVSDGTAHYEPVEGHTRAPWHLDRERVFALFRSSGCALLIDADLPDPESCNAISHIVVNAVHNSPVDRAWTPSLSGDPFVFPNGLKTLKAIFPNADITIAINKRDRKYFESSDISGTASYKILSDKYPQEHPELVVRDIFGIRFVSPAGKRDASVLAVPFFDVVRIAEIMTLGKPLIECIVLAAGPGVSKPGWYRVRIGTPFEELKRMIMKSDDRGPWRIVRGGLFGGAAVNEQAAWLHTDDREITVIREAAKRELYRFMRPGFRWDSYSKTTVADVLPILSKILDSGVHGGERPCVQCNYCDEVCPVSIYPFLIWKHVKAGSTKESFRLRPYDCIGCGLCDYVCPSKITISQAVKEASDAYRTSESDNEAAD